MDCYLGNMCMFKKEYSKESEPCPFLEICKHLGPTFMPSDSVIPSSVDMPRLTPMKIGHPKGKKRGPKPKRRRRTYEEADNDLGTEEKEDGIPEHQTATARNIIGARLKAGELTEGQEAAFNHTKGIRYPKLNEMQKLQLIDIWKHSGKRSKRR